MALLQARQRSGAMTSYKKHAGASSVVAMIEGIISESKEVQADALKAENEAAAGYATFTADTNAALDALSKDITNKSEELAKADVAAAKAQGDLKHTESDLLKLAEYKMQLSAQCDFLTKHFDIRQQKRTEEIEALQSAKAIFQSA